MKHERRTTNDEWGQPPTSPATRQSPPHAGDVESRPPSSTQPSVLSHPQPVGFLTDTTLCIGCKACEVACKQWNGLPLDNLGFTGNSYDNTGDLGATTWRHVAFVEQFAADGARPTAMPPFQSHWLMLSDVCKHCEQAGCLQACPTGAIVRTEFGSVYIQDDICNGCGYCLPACPFGVPALGERDHQAHKCTLCYDRLKIGHEPACAKACPTDSIQFGAVAELRERAHARVASLRERGVSGARLYGDDALGGTGGIDGLNAMFVLTAPPEVYNLPARPTLPQREILPSYLTTIAAAVAFGVATFFSLRENGRR